MMQLSVLTVSSFPRIPQLWIGCPVDIQQAKEYRTSAVAARATSILIFLPSLSERPKCYKPNTDLKPDQARKQDDVNDNQHNKHLFHHFMLIQALERCFRLIIIQTRKVSGRA